MFPVDESLFFLCSFSVSGAVLGGSWGFDRACGLQWNASSGPGRRLQKRIGGGRPAEKRSQNRYDSSYVYMQPNNLLVVGLMVRAD